VGCVARAGGGILLCGPSGSGKSTLSFACARAGWTFVADDCTWLLVGSEDRIAIGKPHQVRFRDNAPVIFPELAGYATTSHPNRKLTIEVPLRAFPQIHTALRCPIRALAFLERRGGNLDRRGGDWPRAEKLPPGEAVEELLPSWRLHFDSLDDGLRLLSELPQP
jgi:hypothetical protein